MSFKLEDKFDSWVVTSQHASLFNSFYSILQNKRYVFVARFSVPLSEILFCKAL